MCKLEGFNNRNTLNELIAVHTTQSIKVWPDGGHRKLSYSLKEYQIGKKKSYSHLKNMTMNRIGKNQVKKKQS